MRVRIVVTTGPWPHVTETVEMSGSPDILKSSIALADCASRLIIKAIEKAEAIEAKEDAEAEAALAESEEQRDGRL